jgi:flagellar basal-body rod protein FlgF
MDKMIFTVLNGMKVTEQRQANTFNELANVNTVGFKKSFSSAVISRDLVAEGGLNSRAFPMLQTDNIVDLSPGSVQRTGHPLDLYVSGQGLFAVQAPDGTEAYTRRGDIKITENGVLTTGAGHLLLGDNGPITLPPSAKVDIAADGTVNILAAGEAGNVMTPVARIKLVNAQDQVMQIRSDGLFQTANKALLQTDADITVMPGAVEGSSASPIDAMVQMIRDSREYEMQVSVFKNAKELSTAGASVVRMDG